MTCWGCSGVSSACVGRSKELLSTRAVIDAALIMMHCRVEFLLLDLPPNLLTCLLAPTFSPFASFPRFFSPPFNRLPLFPFLFYICVSVFIRLSTHTHAIYREIRVLDLILAGKPIPWQNCVDNPWSSGFSSFHLWFWGRGVRCNRREQRTLLSIMYTCTAGSSIRRRGETATLSLSLCGYVRSLSSAATLKMNQQVAVPFFLVFSSRGCVLGELEDRKAAERQRLEFMDAVRDLKKRNENKLIKIIKRAWNR